MRPRIVTGASEASSQRAERSRKQFTMQDTTPTDGSMTSNRVLGMTPSNYRAGGAGAEIHFALGECSLGSILVARSARGICALLLGDDPNALARDLQDGAAAPHAV